MKIVLIGFMASGKSSVAPPLAKKLGLKAVEMDDLIMNQTSGMTIPKIFESGGEAVFRAYEKAVANQLRLLDKVVISTGGGVITDKATWEAVSHNATVVELYASFETLLQRITPAIPRPLFENAEKAKTLYHTRKPLYTKYADISVETTDISIEEVVATIITRLKQGHL